MTDAPEPSASPSSPERRPIKARSTAWAAWATRALIGCGATPNAISVFGMIAALLGGGALWATTRHPDAEPWLFVAGAVLVQVRLLCNLLDGMVAVATERTSAVGDLYNEIPDRISDAAVLIGLGCAVGGDVTLGYLAACVALFVAYVRAMAVTAGAPNDFCGPLAKPHRMAVVTGACVGAAVLPADFDMGIALPALALWIVAIGGAVTAARRIARAARALRREAT